MDPNSFMMAGGMPQTHMQRPQPGNHQDQIHAKIMSDLQKEPINNGTWQATLDPRERAQYIMQMYVEIGSQSPRGVLFDLSTC